MVFGLNQVIVVWIVPFCYSDLASSTHLCGLNWVKIHPYDFPLHQKVFKNYIYIRWMCESLLSGSWNQPCHSGMVCTQLLLRFSHLSLHPWLWWSTDVSIWLYTALKGAQKLHICLHCKSKSLWCGFWPKPSHSSKDCTLLWLRFSLLIPSLWLELSVGTSW